MFIFVISSDFRCQRGYGLTDFFLGDQELGLLKHAVIIPATLLIVYGLYCRYFERNRVSNSV
jgi:hypothetical protein